MFDPKVLASHWYNTPSKTKDVLTETELKKVIVSAGNSENVSMARFKLLQNLEETTDEYIALKKGMIEYSMALVLVTAYKDTQNLTETEWDSAEVASYEKKVMDAATPPAYRGMISETEDF